MTPSELQRAVRALLAADEEPAPPKPPRPPKPPKPERPKPPPKPPRVRTRKPKPPPKPKRVRKPGSPPRWTGPTGRPRGRPRLTKEERARRQRLKRRKVRRKKARRQRLLRRRRTQKISFGAVYTCRKTWTFLDEVKASAVKKFGVRCVWVHELHGGPLPFHFRMMGVYDGSTLLAVARHREFRPTWVQPDPELTYRAEKADDKFPLDDWC